MNYPNLNFIPEEDRSHALSDFAAWWDSIEADPETLPTPVCGMCKHHKIDRFLREGYCSLRAMADMPCRFTSNDSYAERCHFFEQDCPF